jgi:hypothetical protein
VIGPNDIEPIAVFHRLREKGIKELFFNPGEFIFFHEFLNGLKIELIELILELGLILIVVFDDSVEQAHDVALERMGPFFIKNLFGFLVGEDFSQTLVESFVELFLALLV